MQKMVFYAVMSAVVCKDWQIFDDFMQTLMATYAKKYGGLFSLCSFTIFKITNAVLHPSGDDFQQAVAAGSSARTGCLMHIGGSAARKLCHEHTHGVFLQCQSG